MAWNLQTPGADGPKLLSAVRDLAQGAVSGGGAFAFATAKGINLFFAAPEIAALAHKGEIQLIVGMDAITDTAALKALTILTAKLPGLKVLAFLNDTQSCFHPKTVWFRHPKGGVAITGSGNLTTGGLQSNWEAFEIQSLDDADILNLQDAWSEWLAQHKEYLQPLDADKVVERAAANERASGTLRKIARAAKGSGPAELAEAAAEAEAELGQELLSEAEVLGAANRVLIAEVPRSGKRWKQVNFDLDTYQNYFGVTLGVEKHITLYAVKEDGTLDAPEDRLAVAVESQNYRFEVGAGANLPYPANGHPILVFERIAADTYNYCLRMPGSNDHTLIQAYLDDNYAQRGVRKRRIVIDRGALDAIWPANPLPR